MIEDHISLRYTNWRGDTAQRVIVPKRVWFGKTEHHPDPQWLLDCWDVDRNAERTYALAGCNFVARRGR